MARTSFAIRLLIYLLAPLGYLFASEPTVALLVAIGVGSTWMLDYAFGGTIWLSARLATLLLTLGYLLGVALVFITYERSFFSLLVTLALLAVALSSDAVANSHRWKLLLPAAVISIFEFTFHWIFTPFSAEAATYPAVAFLAIMARYLFPRTKHLVHTSLDYPPIRLEILSYGLKRAAAIGIKRL